MEDLSEISELQILKALAYDRLAVIEQNTNELSAINTRIVELQTPTETEKPPTVRKK